MQRIRWLFKPAAFLLCLLPALHLALGVLNATGVSHIGNVSLGADPVRAMLHTCGRWTLNFLFMTLCMTPLKNLTGQPLWLRMRRMLGLFAFGYALLHVGIYVGLDQGGDVSAVWQDIVKRPYITLGFLALLLLLPLAITSTARAQRRLKRRWTQVHRLVYLVALLGVWHFWWQVKKDIREPVLYAAALALLLGYRLWTESRSRPRLSAPRFARTDAI